MLLTTCNEKHASISTDFGEHAKTLKKKYRVHYFMERTSFQQNVIQVQRTHPRLSSHYSGTPAGVLPYMAYIGVCGPRRVFSRFGHKQGIDFGHFGHKHGLVFALKLLGMFFLEEATFSLQCRCILASERTHLIRRAPSWKRDPRE